MDIIRSRRYIIFQPLQICHSVMTTLGRNIIVLLLVGGMLTLLKRYKMHDNHHNNVSEDIICAP